MLLFILYLQFYYDVSENEIWLGEQEIFLTIDDLGKVCYINIFLSFTLHAAVFTITARVQ